MTNVEALFGKAKKVDVELLGGTQLIEFPILTVEQMAPFMSKKKSDEEQFEAIKQLVFLVLERNDPNAKLSDVDKLPLVNMMKIIQKLFEINGLTSEGTTPLDVKRPS